jgi:hypothetical protein
MFLLSNKAFYPYRTSSTYPKYVQSYPVSVHSTYMYCIYSILKVWFTFLPHFRPKRTPSTQSADGPPIQGNVYPTLPTFYPYRPPSTPIFCPYGASFPLLLMAASKAGRHIPDTYTSHTGRRLICPTWSPTNKRIISFRPSFTRRKSQCEYCVLYTCRILA